MQIIQPETLVRWHRSSFRFYWRWKSRHHIGRPKIDVELRALIKRMNDENPLWGAPRIHTELLKLGFDIAQSTVAKYSNKRRNFLPVKDGEPSFANIILTRGDGLLCRAHPRLAAARGAALGDDLEKIAFPYRDRRPPGNR